MGFMLRRKAASLFLIFTSRHGTWMASMSVRTKPSELVTHGSGRANGSLLGLERQCSSPQPEESAFAQSRTEYCGARVKRRLVLCPFTHGEVERFAQKRHDRTQLPGGPDKGDV